jgi:hypothetical protein
LINVAEPLFLWRLFVIIVKAHVAQPEQWRDRRSQ